MGKATLGLKAAAADRPVNLLRRHAGDQAAAAGFKLDVEAELIAAHQASSGVQHRQLTPSVITAFTAEQLEWSCAAPLVFGAAIGGMKLQVAAAVPRIKTLHGLTLRRRRLQLCSNKHQSAAVLIGTLSLWIWRGGAGDGCDGRAGAAPAEQQCHGNLCTCR